ncbi:MAG: response regulator, partial [Lachnospiraceae bacterium]|nr:response regulator [Lachnospiraceae bacterium]
MRLPQKISQRLTLIQSSSTYDNIYTNISRTDYYEVSAVQSGVSAIRAITLDKPDLVLLDYDMPVCDGRHVLEMLRSEKEFADVPVIFLTSRDDPESVKKVLSLKPEGYMMKYLKPTEIRSRVDNFFRKKKAEQAGRS